MKMNFIDRAIELVSPSWAIDRIRARKQLEMVREVEHRFNRRKYEAASKGRHTLNWLSGATSANQEIYTALSTLRNRSRELCRNNEHASNIVRVIANNAIGTGIMPQHVKVSGGANVIKVKEAWNDWADNINCDYDQRLSFYGLQHLALRSTIESGECIIRKVRANASYKIPLRLQLLEADFIDTSKYVEKTAEGGAILYGIEYNADGIRKGYWLWDRHPNEFAATSSFVKADDVIHIYDMERPGQMRGVPGSKSSMIRLNNIGDYEFAEQVRAKMAASFAAFVKVDNDADATTGESIFDTMEPGTIQKLNPGEEITFSSPPLTTNYAEFVKRNLQSVAAGNGITYEAMTSDYSNVNFSSGRMGWLEMSRNVQHWQWNVIIPHLCNRVYQWFIEAAKLAGVIPFTTEMKAGWTPPRREMIDPYKETQAKVLAVQSGFKSYSETLREDGYNPDEVMQEIKEDKTKLEKIGIDPYQKDGAQPPPNQQDAQGNTNNT